MLRYIFILLGLILAWGPVSAQNEIHFSHLGMQDGFANSRANTIIQDRKGFIWVGTWNGLNRYDGYNCVTYQPGFHDSLSVSNREIVELMEDSNGFIWIGTSYGLSRLDPETGIFKNYQFRNRILSLCEDKNGQLWIGTWSGGLYRFNPETGESVHYLASDIVSDVHVDSRGILWAATYYGLLRKMPDQDEFVRFIADSSGNSISNSVVTQIAESADGSLWVGTWGGGVDRISLLDDGQSMQFSNFKLNGKTDDAGVVSRLYYDQFHNLWIGTWNDGLRMLPENQQKRSPADAELIAYHKEADNPASLSDAGISALCVDHAGILWVGAATIDRAAVSERGINRYKLPATKDELTRKRTVRAFAEFRNQLFVAAGNSLFQYERKQEQYFLRTQYTSLGYPNGNNTVRSSSILDLKSDSTGLWIGTEDAGLIFYPYSNQLLLDKSKVQYFNHQSATPISGDKVCSIVLSRHHPGVLWLGTLQSGITKLERGADGRYASRFFSVGAGSLSDNNIRTMYEDSFGKIWIGTQDGLNSIDPETKQFQQFFYTVEDTNSLNDNVINTIFEDSSGNLWVGTNSGLNKRIEHTTANRPRMIQFKGFPGEAYLNNEIVTNLFEDASGNLWVRMYRGFIKLNIKDEKVAGQYFSRDYENLMLQRNSSSRFRNGQVILDAQNGFLTFFPDSIVKNSISPHAVITGLKVLNQSVDGNSELQQRLGLSKTIPYTEQLELSYKDKMITIEFSAMDYKSAGKNEFSYKLEGFDNQWNNVGARNTATYTNLPPGKYTLKVKAKNSDGVWSEDAASLALQINPPFWKTTWAYLVYLLIIIGLLYFFNQYSVVRAQVKSELKFEKLKTEELSRLNEMKSFFLTDITHELKTPLSLILGPANELAGDKSLNATASRHAGLIKSSANKLLHLVNQLLEFRRIEKGIPDELRLQTVDVSSLLEDISAMFRAMSESRRINYQLSLPPSRIVAMLDPDKFEKILFNLISNAFKYTRDHGAIRVLVGLNQTASTTAELIIKVEDNGIGIAEKHKNKIFERFYQVNEIRTQSTGGIGLYMTKALIDQHNGSIELESEPGKGSCFTVHLPYIAASLPEPEVHEATAETELTVVSETDDEPTSEATKLTVLVLEDERELNEFLVNGLSPEFRVISAFNGAEGLQLAQSEMPDLILSDIMMPEMDGFEFCKRLRKDLNSSHIPVVFLTAKTMQEDELKGLRLGAVDYIFKPFNLDALKLKLQNILVSRRQMQERLRTEQLLEPELIELSSLDEEFLKQAVEAVQNNLDNPAFDVEAFSNELGASANQVYRKIKALTGQTAKEFIRNQRLKIAAGMLAQKKRNISEIIYMVGFSSPSYFTRCFKEFYGCTPKEYIEKFGDNTSQDE